MKTAIEYLQALEEELKYLPQKEVRNVLKVYQEKINNALDYGEPIEKVLKDLPSPKDIAKGIYDSKKVNYLDRRQREYRRKELVNSLTSLLLAVIVTLVFVGIIGYLTVVSFGMLEILPKFAGADKIIMGGFVIAYLITMLLVIIYLVDLGLLIITFLLSKALSVFKNLKIDYEALQSFSLTGAVDKLLKKKNLVGKVLLVFALIMVVFGATSVIGKGYLSRSFSDTVSTKNEEIVELDDTISTINLENTKAKIIIKKAEKFRIIKNSEFDRHFEVIISSDTATIKFDKHQNYDFLGLLTEPTIVITIEMPIAKNVNIKLDRGQIAYDGAIVLESSINLASGSVALKDAKVENLIFKTQDAELNSNGCIYNKVDLDIVHGRFASSSDKYQDAVINNGSGNIAIKDNEFDNLKLKNVSGTVVIQKSKIDMYDYESNASILTMSEIESKYFNISALNASQFTLTDLKAELYTFDLNAGYLNVSKIVGDVNIVKSLSNMTFSELIGDIKGNIENSTLSVYNSVFDIMDVDLINCNLDLDNVTIKNIDVVCHKVQALFIDVYSENIKLELNTSNLEYYNNTTKHVGNIYIKNVGSQYNINETVKYAGIKVE